MYPQQVSKKEHYYIHQLQNYEGIPFIIIDEELVKDMSEDTYFSQMRQSDGSIMMRPVQLREEVKSGNSSPATTTPTATAKTINNSKRNAGVYPVPEVLGVPSL